MITRYSGNSKPYIYTAFPKNEEETVMAVLQTLSDHGVELWYEDCFTAKEKRRLEGSFGVLLFVNDEFSKSERFHDIVNNAVSFNQNILCIYLENVQPSPWMRMQLGSQLALFKNNYDSIDILTDKIMSAQIFQNMTVTDAQKRFQRNRGIAMVAVPLAAVAVLFFAVINPLLIEPARIDNNVIKQLGLSKSDLNNIHEIHIVGNQIFDTFVHAWYADNNHDLVRYDKNVDGNMEHQDSIPCGSITSEDLAILEQMPNLNLVEIEGQQITDLSYLPRLNVRSVRLNCNPIKSLDGIENFPYLEFISITDTYVSDISPLLSLKNLRTIQLDNCSVSDLSGIENLPNLNSLFIGYTKINKIPKLGSIYNLTLDVRGIKIDDWSFISDVRGIKQLQIDEMGDSMRPDQVMPYIKGKPIDSIAWCGIKSLDEIKDLNIVDGGRLCLANNYLTTLEGIEQFEGISYLDLFHHKGDPVTFSDLSPIKNLKSLELLSLSPDMQLMADQQLQDAHFEIEYRWG